MSINTAESVAEKPRAVLGVIGGMGLDTSNNFINNLVSNHPEFFAKQSGANEPAIGLQYTLARHHGLDRGKEQAYIEEGRHLSEFEAVVVQSALNLVSRGATHIILVCNTAHRHTQAIRDAIGPKIYFLSIVDAVEEEVRQSHLPRVLLMATPSTTFGVKLYDSIPNIVKPLHEDQNLITSVIHNILEEKLDPADVLKLAQMALKYGTDGFLFACTDLAIIKNEFEKQLIKFGEPRIILESTQALEKFVIENLVSAR